MCDYPGEESCRILEKCNNAMVTNEHADSQGSRPDRELFCTIPPSVIHRLPEISGQLARTVMAHMSTSVPFFAKLDASRRADIGTLVQATINFFVEWVHHPENEQLDFMTVLGPDYVRLAKGLNLQQSVSILRSTMEIIEQSISAMKETPETKATLLIHVLHYGRDLGFSIADYFAMAAEKRGAWDARMETALVDAVVRGEKAEDIRSFCSILSCDSTEPVTVVVGTPRTLEQREHPVLRLHQTIAEMGYLALAAVHGRYLVVITNIPADILAKPECPIYGIFSTDQIILGPTARNITRASRSVEEAFEALRVAQAMPNVPHVASADMFIPERAIAGDRLAIQRLFHDIIRPLQKSANQAIRDTLRLYLSVDGGVEEAARRLYVHQNTVRYRLKRVNDITGLDPLDSRMRFTLRIANILEMLEGTHESSIGKPW